VVMLVAVAVVLVALEATHHLPFRLQHQLE
jgi:hypothetical protein